MERVRTVIMGAAGRDFHVFNTVYRDDPAAEVVAFTAAQIPGIAGRRYPPALAGALYPDGIPIRLETDLADLVAAERVRRVVFAYSDVAHVTVMHTASRALAAGADFVLHGPDSTMLAARRPVIALSAVRTGCGKSPASRWLVALLRRRGFRPVVIRHPMPYGDLARQAVQRFASAADLDAAHCTIEEREEYAPHIAAGTVVFAGVDTARVLAAAEAEADLIVWEGGNNDFPFLRPALHLVLADALRSGHETAYHPGETVLRMADAVLIAKANAAPAGDVAAVAAAARAANPRAAVLPAALVPALDRPEFVRGKRVLVVEDGPTTTHGGRPHGAGYAAALAAGAEVVDPHPYAVPAIAAVYAAYPHVGPVLPAVGYDDAQLAALAGTIAAVPCEAVVLATPGDIGALISIRQPVVRCGYEFADPDGAIGGWVGEALAARGIVPG